MDFIFFGLSPVTFTAMIHSFSMPDIFWDCLF